MGLVFLGQKPDKSHTIQKNSRTSSQSGCNAFEFGPEGGRGTKNWEGEGVEEGGGY